MGDAGRPAPVLSQQGAVQAQTPVQRLHRALRRERAEDGAARITGQHLAGEEDEQAQQDEREQRQAYAFQQVLRQAPPPNVLAAVKRPRNSSAAFDRVPEIVYRTCSESNGPRPAGTKPGETTANGCAAPGRGARARTCR